MPVTAKLSRRFYQQFGDELTNELVEWFNSVDASYQRDFRELNETNFARFDAKLEQRAAGIEAKLEAVEARLEASLGGRIDVLSAIWDRRFSEHRESLTKHLAAFESRLTRWMIGLWTGSMLAMVGLLVAIIRSH